MKMKTDERYMKIKRDERYRKIKELTEEMIKLKMITYE